jgi:hypothetical protein
VMSAALGGKPLPLVGKVSGGGAIGVTDGCRRNLIEMRNRPTSFCWPQQDAEECKQTGKSPHTTGPMDTCPAVIAVRLAVHVLSILQHQV